MINPSHSNNKASFDENLCSIPALRIGSSGGSAAIAAQGAQVISWIDPHGRERLYFSPKTMGLASLDDTSAVGLAIRGGVPVCFPQFSDRGPLMKHGFARTRIWEAAELSSPSSALFRFGDDESTRAQWPHRFDAQLSAEVGQGRLRVRLHVTNAGDTPFTFTVALHTYLRVEDIRRTALFGLQGLTFEDATEGMRKKVQQEEKLLILDETDRVYLDVQEKLVLHEGTEPSLHIEQEGFADTVVWNPGPAKAKDLADLPDDDWLRMLCVEAACAARPVCLQPGESWTGSQILTVPGFS